MNEKDSPSLAPGFTSTEANATEDPYFETSLHEVEVPQNEPVKAPSPPPKPRGNPMRWLAIAAVLGVLAYIGIAPRIRQSHELSSEVTAIKDSVPEVQEVSLSSAQPTSDLSLPSNIQAIDSTTVDAQTVGYLKTRYVDIGSVVKKGELLAIVASPETDQQVGASLAEVAKSRSGVSQAEADVSKGQAGVAAARAVVIQDKAAVSQSRADLAGLKADQARVESSIRVAIAQQNEAKTRLDSARAVLAREQSGYTIADKTLRRWQELFKQQAVPGQEVDEKQADFDSATARVAAARSGISTAEADLEAATESIQVARAQLDAAKANVQSGTHKVSLALATVDAANAAVQASYATVRAGTSGVSSAQAVVTADQANAQRYEAMQGFERIVAPFSGGYPARARGGRHRA
jgi:multidrug efflux pump subunit AcrA (membrane-fusion protein)